MVSQARLLEHPPLVESESPKGWRWCSQHETILFPPLDEEDDGKFAPEALRGVKDWWIRSQSGIPWDVATNSCAWDSAINMALCMGLAACKQDLIPREFYNDSLVSPAHHEYRSMIWSGIPVWEHKTAAQKDECRKRIHSVTAALRHDSESAFKSVALTCDEILRGSAMSSWTLRKHLLCPICGVGRFVGRAHKDQMALTAATEAKIREAARLRTGRKIGLSEALNYWSGTSYDGANTCTNGACRHKLSVTWKLLDRLPRFLRIDDVWVSKLGDVVEWDERAILTVQHTDGPFASARYVKRAVQVYLEDDQHFEFHASQRAGSQDWYRWGKLPAVGSHLSRTTSGQATVIHSTEQRRPDQRNILFMYERYTEREVRHTTPL